MLCSRHNLAGEGPRYGAPVELCFGRRKRGNSPRDLLIALLPRFTDFATTFREDEVDFVPIDEH